MTLGEGFGLNSSVLTGSTWDFYLTSESPFLLLQIGGDDNDTGYKWRINGKVLSFIIQSLVSLSCPIEVLKIFVIFPILTLLISVEHAASVVRCKSSLPDPIPKHFSAPINMDSHCLWLLLFAASTASHLTCTSMLLITSKLQLFIP